MRWRTCDYIICANVRNIKSREWRHSFELVLQSQQKKFFRLLRISFKSTCFFLLSFLVFLGQCFCFCFPFHYEQFTLLSITVCVCVSAKLGASAFTAQSFWFLPNGWEEYSIVCPLQAHIPEQKNRLQHTAPAHAKAALHTPAHTHTHIHDSHTLHYCGLKSLRENTPCNNTHTHTYTYYPPTNTLLPCYTHTHTHTHTSWALIFCDSQ